MPRWLGILSNTILYFENQNDVLKRSYSVIIIERDFFDLESTKKNE